MINNFRGEWPTNWNGRPFDNTFWLRNPTVLDERLMDHSGGRETGVAEAFAPRAIELRGHFVENFDVQRHFADPARAWDEAFKANDGGVSYLVNSLIPVCDPAIKRAQVRGQLEVQLRRLVDRLAGFHSAADGDARLKKRDLVQTVLRGLATCIQQQLFGELVASLQIADTALRDIYLRIATARSAEEPDGQGTASRPVRSHNRPAPQSISAPSSPTFSARRKAAAHRRPACSRIAPSASRARRPSTGSRTCAASAPTRRRCRISASTASISAG